jgi:hypothetical protein
VIRSILAITVPNLSGEPGQVTEAVNPAAAANNSQRPILLAMSAPVAIAGSPSASQASRLRPDGTSYDSAQTARTQSRRSAGSSRNATPAATPAARLSLPTTPPPRSPARPAHPVTGSTAGRPARAARAPGRAADLAALAGASIAQARPPAVSRYRWRRGRPGAGSGCQHASTSPRSASRIKIGYSVPDFSPVCTASAYPCRQCDGSSHSAASTDSVWAENLDRDLTPQTLHR